MSTEAHLTALIAIAGLSPSVNDREAMLRMYETLAPRVRALYDVAEARYEQPAPVFRATPDPSGFETGPPV
jgi:hypothetical protein